VTAALALVSARAARGLDEDMPPLLAACAARGVHAEIADWDDPGVEWARFDAALLRSAWDYAERLPQFLAWAERTAALTTLLNPLAVVRWNCDKHYLRELAQAGAAVVPTTFAEPGADAPRVLAEFLAQQGGAQLVVKPAIGAGSRDARRHPRGATAEILAHIGYLLAARRSVMLQPYLEGVDDHGESALIFIAGRFSHAVRKGPMLPAGAPATAALFAPEEISVRIPDAAELALAQRVLARLPFGELLYARVDLIHDASHRPCVLELELNEPSLYLAHAPAAAEQLLAALLARLHLNSDRARAG
jgi:glutathione synthase/RimK-type ligase-like ATP-grasp enzyme